MALHEQCVGKTDEWYTPPHVFRALGCSFDTDVSSPGRDVTPWIPAWKFITADSLSADWHGFVWMNPPFGGRNGMVPWLQKFFHHGNGIALTPDRTSAPWWQKFAPMADAVLFVAPKLKFIGADGKPGTSPAQGTCLMAAGPRGEQALRHASGLGFVMTAATVPTPGTNVSDFRNQPSRPLSADKKPSRLHVHGGTSNEEAARTASDPPLDADRGNHLGADQEAPMTRSCHGSAE